MTRLTRRACHEPDDASQRVRTPSRADKLRNPRHASRSRFRRNHRTGGADLRLPRRPGQLRRRIAAMDQGEVWSTSGRAFRMPAGNFDLHGHDLQQRHPLRSRPDKGSKIQYQPAGDGRYAHSLLLRRSTHHAGWLCAGHLVRDRLRAARTYLRAAGGAQTTGTADNGSPRIAPAIARAQRDAA